MTEFLRSADKPNAPMRNVRFSRPNLKLQGAIVPKLPKFTPPPHSCLVSLLTAIFDKPKIHLKQLHLSNYKLARFTEVARLKC